MPIDDLDPDRVIPLFGALSPDTVDALLRRHRPISLQPGTFIYRQGDPVSGLYVLLPADVAALPQLVDVTWTNQTTGRTLRLEQLRAPAMLGHIEMVQSGFLLRLGTGFRPGAAHDRLTSARAVTALKLVHIPYPTLELLTQDEATVLAAFLSRKAAEAFAGALGALHDAFIDDGTYRLAAWLRQETAATPNGGMSGSAARTRPLKQEEIAKQVGLRRDTLNQKLKMLEMGGVIAVLPSREIVVHDLERLDQLADLAIRIDFATFDTVRGTIKDALASGNAFRARNLALEALGRFPNHPEVRHQAVLATLRCGAFEEAIGLLAVFGWDGDLDTVLTSISDGYAAPRGVKRRDEFEAGEQDDAKEEKKWARDREANERRLKVDVLALPARTAKDLAFAALRSRRQGFIPAAVEASARYAVVADRFLEDSYCAINAAAMALVSGDADRAEKYARRALMGGAPRTYWDYATAMEGHLILGEREHALAAARDAMAVDVEEVSRAGMIASTRLQLRRLAPSCGALAMELRNILTQGQIAYVSGHLPPQPDPNLSLWKSIEPELSNAIERAYTEARIGAVVCALAAGSDLLLAERALAVQAAVHVVLPVPVDLFLEHSVLVGDTVSRRHWRTRFDAVLARARKVTVLEEDKPVKARLAFDEAVYAGNRHAAGVALLQADEWECDAVMICIHDGSPPGSIAGTARIRAEWQALGHYTIPLACSWRAGRQLVPQEDKPVCFGAVLFVWLALPGDHDRHQTKPVQLIDEHLERAEDLLRHHLQHGERLERRVLTNQMVGLYLGLRDLSRAQSLAAAVSYTQVPGLDGLRIVLDFGGVFTGHRLSEARVVALQGARDNIELPLGTVVLTEAFAAEARFMTQEPAPYAQIGLQTRKQGANRVPRSAIRYYRGSDFDI